MEIIKTRKALSVVLEKSRKNGDSIGFVPTMGALHEGHLSLVRLSKQDNAITVVSIFVNPTQFNDAKDLEKYPRMPEKDAALLEKEKVDYIYMPEVDDVYPNKEMHTFNLEGLDEILEGKFRPGHFKGVADVVYRLLSTVLPDNAYFGEKDFQQLKIIEQMVKVSGLKVKIKSGEIIREHDGLAMSSRNLRLSKAQREIAPHIYKEMTSLDFSLYKNQPQKAEEFLVEAFNKYEHLKTEYVAIVDDQTMKTPETLKSQCVYRLCVAVWCGEVRLIDNLKFVV